MALDITFDVVYYSSENQLNGWYSVKRTEAMDRAIKKYESEKLDKILLRVPKGNKERIQEHAKSQGESTNAFIYRAVNEAIERDTQK